MQKSLGVFLNTAIYRAIHMFNYDPTDSDLSPFLDVMNYLVDQLKLFESALRISFT